MLEWNSVNGSTESMAQEEAYIKKAQKPCTGRCTGLVKNSICSSLDCLETFLSWVLELMV